MTEPPLIHLTLDRGSFTCTRYCASYWRHLKKRTTVQLYETALERNSWPRGVVLVTCTDGMNAAQTRLATRLHQELSKHTQHCAVLNDPARLLGRYELLKSLCQQGLNDFDVFRADAVPADVRFPVFVRYEHLHRGNLTPVLHTRAELDDALAKLFLQGERPEELLVVEWLDYRDADGHFRKYAAQKIGTHVFGKHLMAGPHWMIKRKTTDTKAVGDEELPFVTDFPHHEQLAPLWETAQHEWARVDYSFYKGRLQVWEVNDNPEMGTKWRRDFGRKEIGRRVFAHFDRAFADVAQHVQEGPDFPLDLTGWNAEKPEIPLNTAPQTVVLQGEGGGSRLGDRQ